MIAYLADGWVEIDGDKRYRLSNIPEEHDPGILPEMATPPGGFQKNPETPDLRAIIRLVCARWQRQYFER